MGLGSFASVSAGAGGQEGSFFPLRRVTKTDAVKIVRADDLTGWVKEVMMDHQAEAAVITRMGGAYTRKFDWTGMGHAGILIRSHDAKANKDTWWVMNLFSDENRWDLRSELWRTSIEDFFYAQRTAEKQAMVLIPPKSVQVKLVEGFVAHGFKQMLFTTRYNIISDPLTDKSLNCVKWIAMTLKAAQLDESDPAVVLTRLTEGMTANTFEITWLEKIGMRFMAPLARWDELIGVTTIRTVSVVNLYESDWFEERVVYGDPVANEAQREL
ncbi:MAG: DUF2145 domain-containing protein [Vampirovibrio sp.]|nr:DUF2145 domain-containing protein [Vampirovibrio sp.]